MTQTQKRFWCVLVRPSVLLSGSGCNDNDDEVLNTPVDQAVETALNSALTTTVVPLVGFMAAVGDLLSCALQGVAGGLACPDTGGLGGLHPHGERSRLHLLTSARWRPVASCSINLAASSDVHL